MFQEWGFLLAEIWALLALAAVIGLIAGWLIFGRPGTPAVAGEAETLRADLDQVRAMHAEKDERIRALETELDDLRSAAVARTVSEAAVADDPAASWDRPVEGAKRTKPEMLDAARGGTPDDLKRIKGIGPQLERMCFQMGFFHYDQIAVWTEAEVAWVDAHLEGFKGRVTRDGWVAQAQAFAAGGATDFSKKVDEGDVY